MLFQKKDSVPPLNVTPERFDDDYQYFLELTQTPARNDRHAQIIEDVLALKPGDHVLDAPCGIGRIAVRLAAKGINVVGIDANQSYIERAKDIAAQEGLSIDYRHADMRNLCWKNKFDAIVCWFISFGYFDEQTDKIILKEFFKALRPGGSLLIEHVYLPGYLRSLPATGETSSQVERDNNFMTMETQFDPIISRNKVRRTVLRDGKKSCINFDVRFFMPQEFHAWLMEAGFSSIKFLSKHGADTIPFDADRMLLIAKKE